jgi:hypothetical protein
MANKVLSKDVRARLEEALRLDLVGPWAGSPYEAEELPEAPSHWYVTGFLVPNEAPTDQKEDPTADEQLDLGIESAAGDDDAVPEKASARRGRLPSSIGISVLVPPASTGWMRRFGGATTSSLRMPDAGRNPRGRGPGRERPINDSESSPTL